MSGRPRDPFEDAMMSPTRSSTAWLATALAICSLVLGGFAAWHFAGRTQPDASVQEIAYVGAGGGAKRGAIWAPHASTDARPLLLLLDPRGNASAIVRRWQAGAKEHGWLLASSSHIRNGTADRNDAEELLAMLDYMREHHDVDESRVFLGGFSGGACGAYHQALSDPAVYRGAFVENGHMGPWREFEGELPSDPAFYLFTRDGDFNRDATRQLYSAMRAAGLTVQLDEQSGGHKPMARNETGRAIAWMEAQTR